MKNKPIFMLCARADSKRLPGKLYRKINGLPAIEHILSRNELTGFKTVVLMPENEPEWSKIRMHKFRRKYHSMSICYGRPDSPLHRMADYFALGEDSRPKYIIRQTQDDLIMDPDSVMRMLYYAEKQRATYSCMPSIIEGAGVEIISTKVLIEAARKHKEPIEHVSYFVKGDMHCTNVPRGTISRNYRLTVDYLEDAVVLEVVLRNVGNNASVDTICAYLDKNKHLLDYNKLPELSIYTCAYNAEKTIKETICSILSGTFTGSDDMEYIIVEDGSADNTLAIIMETKLKYDYHNKIKLIVNEENKGLASSSNIALENARGKYIMRIDADDTMISFSSRNLMDFIEKEKHDIVYPGYNILDEQGRSMGTGDPRIYHHAGGALMRKKMINELKFKEGLRHWDSLDLYKRICKHNDISIGYYNAPAFNYRMNPLSMSRSGLSNRSKMRREIDA